MYRPKSTKVKFRYYTLLIEYTTIGWKYVSRSGLLRRYQSK